MTRRLAFLLFGAAVTFASVTGALALFSDSAGVAGNAFSTDQLDPPNGLGANGGPCVSLSWTITGDTYASGYNVLRASSSGGPYSSIAQLTPRTVASHTDSPSSGTYYYKLESYYQSWTSSQTAAVSAIAGDTWYLHNNPSPPTGDTNSQANLPFDLTSGSATTLYDYDENRDSAAGLLLERSNNGLSETDTRAFQAWRSDGVACALTISGTATFTFFSATEDFENSRQGSVVAYLRHYDGSSFTTIGQSTLTVGNWQGGSGTWVEKSISLTGLSYTVPAGDYLELRIQVTDDSDRDMIFAYDTTSYPTRLVLP